MPDEAHEPDSSAFGALLRPYRLAAGLSQEPLPSAGVTRGASNCWASGGQKIKSSRTDRSVALTATVIFAFTGCGGQSQSTAALSQGWSAVRHQHSKSSPLLYKRPGRCVDHEPALILVSSSMICAQTSSNEGTFPKSIGSISP